LKKNKRSPHFISSPRNAVASTKTKHSPSIDFAKVVGRLDPKTRLKQKGKAARANEKYINYWLNVVTFDKIYK